MKRIISLIAAIIMLFSLTLPAQATTDTTEYIRLIPGKERLNEDGTFTMYLRNYMRSDHNFITTSSQIYVAASARVYNSSTQTYRNDENVTFTFFLYREGIENYVGYHTFTANGQSNTVSFPVTTGAEYYFKIHIDGRLTETEWVDGSGRLSNIYIILD